MKKIDIDRLLKDMADAIWDVIKEESGDIKENVKNILDSEKEFLEKLAEAKLRGEIDDAVFEREIRREKKVIEAELLTIRIMTKATAQRAVNAAMEVLVTALKIAI